MARMPKKRRIIKSKDDHQLQFLHSLGIDRANREIWLTSEYTDAVDDMEPGVEHNMATRFLKNLWLLERDSLTKSILVHMKTCGGWVEEGYAIYDAILCSPCTIRIISYTYARSMSSIIFEAADERIMLPNSSFMFHRGHMLLSGSMKEIYTEVDWVKRFDEIMLDAYIKRMKERGKFSKWSPKRIREMLVCEMDKKSDVNLTAQETIDWGLADSILHQEMIREDIKRKPRR